MDSGHVALQKKFHIFWYPEGHVNLGSWTDMEWTKAKNTIIYYKIFSLPRHILVDFAKKILFFFWYQIICLYTNFFRFKPYYPDYTYTSMTFIPTS